MSSKSAKIYVVCIMTFAMSACSTVEEKTPPLAISPLMDQHPSEEEPTQPDTLPPEPSPRTEAAPVQEPGSQVEQKVKCAMSMFPSGITHYQSVGSGPVIILVHGVSGPLSVWDKSVEPLVKAGYRVVRYDLYGRGFSSRLESAPYSLDTYVTQLEELVQALKLGSNVRLVGSSLGAIVSTEYALRHPTDVKGLILIGPAGFPITVPPTAKLKDIPLVGGIFRAYPNNPLGVFLTV